MLQNLCGVKDHFKGEVCTDTATLTELIQGSLREVIMILPAASETRSKLAFNDSECCVASSAMVETWWVLTFGLDRRAFEGRCVAQFRAVLVPSTSKSRGRYRPPHLRFCWNDHGLQRSRAAK